MKERSWATKIYAHPRRPERVTNPYVCRISIENRNSFSIEWIDLGAEGSHTLYYRLRNSECDYTAIALTESTVTVDGLEPATDYEFFIERDADKKRSNTRLVHCCDVTGHVINYNHPDDQTYNETGHAYYIGSPFIVKLPSGRLLVSHDFHNGPIGEGQVIIFKSDDNGKSWQHLTEIYPMFWARMFVNNCKLYIVGPYGAMGDICISESCDEGATWKAPVVLIHGDGFVNMMGHSTSTPVTIHNGRIYLSAELGRFAWWKSDAFGSMILSAPCDSDLLCKESWDHTPLAFFDPLNIDLKAEFITGMEGNVMVGPDGEIYNLWRMDPLNCDRSVPRNHAIVWKLKNFDEPLEFVKIINPLVGIRHKFYIQKDEKTGLYFLIGNEENETNLQRRSILSLSVSEDLFNWRKLTTLLDVTPTKGAGVSYPSFIIDGDDIIYLSRTSCGKAKNEHDNNMATIHRLENFRALL